MSNTDKEYAKMNDIENPHIDITLLDTNIDKWDDGLCSCFNNIYPSMICTIFTPVVYLSQMSEKIYQKNYYIKNMSIYIFGNTILLFIYPYNKKVVTILAYMLNIYYIILARMLRTNVREKYNIPGSICEDILLSVFLTPFSIAQTGRTLYKYKKICDEQETCNSG